MRASNILDSVFGVPKTVGSIFVGQQGNSGMDPPPPVLKVREYPPGSISKDIQAFQLDCDARHLSIAFEFIKLQF